MRQLFLILTLLGFLGWSDWTSGRKSSPAARPVGAAQKLNLSSSTGPVGQVTASYDGTPSPR